MLLPKGRSSHRRIILKGTGRGQKQPTDVLYEENTSWNFHYIQRNKGTISRTSTLKNICKQLLLKKRHLYSANENLKVYYVLGCNRKHLPGFFCYIFLLRNASIYAIFVVVFKCNKNSPCLVLENFGASFDT